MGEVWSAELSYANVVGIFLQRGPCVVDAFPAVFLAVARVVGSVVEVDRLWLVDVRGVDVGVGLLIVDAKVIHLCAARCLGADV